MQVDVLNIKGEVVDTLDLADSVFSIEPNRDAIYRVMLAQQANRRQGTSKTKGRSEVRGGGRKPYRQKGTGRARHGSTRSPIWVGGGVTFGPQPRSYAYKLPKKQRRLALKSALSSKVNAEEIRVLEELNFDAPKTKEMLKVLSGLSTEKKALVVTADYNDTVALSARNIPGVKFITATSVNVLDLLNYDHLIITQDAVKKVEEVLA